MLRATELAQDIHIIGWCLWICLRLPCRFVNPLGECFDALSLVCYEFDEITIIQAILVISCHTLETEDLGISLILVPISLGMEISITWWCRIRRILVCTEECTWNGTNRRVDDILCCSIVCCLGWCNVILAQSSLQLIVKLRRCSIVSSTRFWIIDLDRDDIRWQRIVVNLNLASCRILLAFLEFFKLFACKFILGVQ